MESEVIEPAVTGAAASVLIVMSRYYVADVPVSCNKRNERQITAIFSTLLNIRILCWPMTWGFSTLDILFHCDVHQNTLDYLHVLKCTCTSWLCVMMMTHIYIHVHAFRNPPYRTVKMHKSRLLHIPVYMGISWLFLISTYIFQFCRVGGEGSPHPFTFARVFADS